jgi:Double zinc ribbon
MRSRPPHLCPAWDNPDQGTRASVDDLDLIFRRLVLAARAAGALERQVTVGELLDQFVPYAAARRDGGLETHDDYLHALMRLVSGERSLLFGDDLMQDDLKAELQSGNPELTALRTYAQTKLRISTAGVQSVLAGDTDIDLRPPTPVARPSVGAKPSPTSGGFPIAEPMTEPRASGALQSAFSAYASSLAAAVEGATAGGPPPGTVDLGCPYCAQALPTGRSAKFCPSCGLNLLVRRCPGCSAEIESGWKFCVTCGRKA